MRSRGLQHRWRVALGAVAGLLLAQPASAFYWYGWPGSGVTDPPVLVPRPAVKTVSEVTPPPVVVDPPDPPRPQDVPEPATLLAAAVGLAAVAAVRRRKSAAQRRSP